MGNRTTVSSAPAGRLGFTLIELLVVMAIVVLLASMAVVFVPSALDSQQAAQGATRVQGWLMIAKSRAVLDRAPRGVRLLVDNTGNPNVPPNMVTSMQYIEQPDDFFGGTVSSTPDPNNPGKYLLNQLTFANVDLSGGFAAANDPTAWPVQVGDYVQVQGTGLVHRITTMTSATAVQLVPPGLPPPGITTPTAAYRIIRAPRVSSEEPLSLPSNVGIDLSVSSSSSTSLVPLPPPPPPIDILFSPSGAIVGNPGSDRLILWVRDYTQANAVDGEPTLITVYTRAGTIAAVPVDPTPSGNPYSFVR